MKSLKSVDPHITFVNGSKFFKRVRLKKVYTYWEYRLIWANWEGPYMMLTKRISENENRAEYGIIPVQSFEGKKVVNKLSLINTLGINLKDWFFEDKPFNTEIN